MYQLPCVARADLPRPDPQALRATLYSDLSQLHKGPLYGSFSVTCGAGSWQHAGHLKAWLGFDTMLEVLQRGSSENEVPVYKMVWILK